MKTGAIVAIVVAAVVVAGVGIFIATSGNNNNPEPSPEATYEVSFTAENGTVDKATITVKSGTTFTAEYNVLKFSDGQTVTATANKGYVFSKWSQSSGTIVKKQTITATFASNTATVSFETQNCTVDKTSIQVEKGTTFTAESNVLIFSDNQTVTATPSEGYTFGYWSKVGGTINDNITITAVSTKPGQLVVTFVAENGSVDKSPIQVEKGTTFTAESNVLKFSDNQTVTATPTEGYTFDSWSPSSGTVDSDLTITVNFTAQETKTVSFYFTDNLANDLFVASGDTYETYPYAIIPGVWVKGTGAGIEGALKDACNSFGIDVTVSSGVITKIDSVVDGNVFIWGWDGTAWFEKNASGAPLKLDDEELSQCEYISIVHGAASADGGAPTVGTLPEDIVWYYGDDITPGSGVCVKFYACNNFEYTTFVSKRTDEGYNQSDYHTLLVKGLWIRGYADAGSPVGDAFCNAMDRIGYDYSYEAGWIPYINECTGGNFFQAIWDNDSNEWYNDSNAHYFAKDIVDDVSYAAIVYGAWDGGATTHPLPLEVASQCTWAY